MNGDLFSSNYDYERLQLSDSDVFTLSTVAMSKTVTCKRNEGTFYEGFEDEKFLKVKDAGPIMCSSINGKLVSFPETYQEFKALMEYSESLLYHKNIAAINVYLGAISYSEVPDLPKIGYPPNGYSDIYELGTERKLNPDERVKKSIFKSQHSYQTEEDLCYFMASLKEFQHPKGFDAEQHALGSIRCDAYNNWWWTFCKFERKILLKISGLCTLSPVDKIFTLLEPGKEVRSRIGEFAGE